MTYEVPPSIDDLLRISCFIECPNSVLCLSSTTLKRIIFCIIFYIFQRLPRSQLSSEDAEAIFSAAFETECFKACESPVLDISGLWSAIYSVVVTFEIRIWASKASLSKVVISDEVLSIADILEYLLHFENPSYGFILKALQ